MQRRFWCCQVSVLTLILTLCTATSAGKMHDGLTMRLEGPTKRLHNEGVTHCYSQALLTSHHAHQSCLVAAVAS